MLGAGLRAVYIFFANAFYILFKTLLIGEPRTFQFIFAFGAEYGQRVSQFASAYITVLRHGRVWDSKDIIFPGVYKRHIPGNHALYTCIGFHEQKTVLI